MVKRNNFLLFFFSYTICYTVATPRPSIHLTFYFLLPFLQLYNIYNKFLRKGGYMKDRKLDNKKLHQQIQDSFNNINYMLERQRKPLRKARNKLSNKTKYNFKQLENVLCGSSSKYENLRKLLLDYDRYRILIDFYIVTDNLKIDKKRVKKEGNKNKGNRFTTTTTNSGDYFFALPIDKFMEIRGGSRNSLSKNINLFVFLGLIGKRNPYEIEWYSIFRQEQERQNKIAETEARINRGEIYIDKTKRKIDYNFTTLYFIRKVNNKILKEAEEKAKKLFDNNFSIRAFTSLYVSKYFRFKRSRKSIFSRQLAWIYRVFKLFTK